MVRFEQYFRWDSSVAIKTLEVDGIPYVFEEEVINIIPHLSGRLRDGLTSAQSASTVSLTFANRGDDGKTNMDMRPVVMQWFDEWKNSNPDEYITIITFKNSQGDTYNILRCSRLMEYNVSRDFQISLQLKVV